MEKSFKQNLLRMIVRCSVSLAKVTVSSTTRFAVYKPNGDIEVYKKMCEMKIIQ